jgi:hypothetical protein
MTFRNRIGLTGAVTALGLGASLIGASPAFDAHSIWKTLLFRGGIGCCVVGVVFYVLLSLTRAGRKIGELTIRLRQFEYVSSYIVNDQIPEIVVFGCSSVGPENHITEAELAKHFAVNNKIIRRLDRVSSDGRRKLAGYYILLPLRKEITQRIIAGRVLTGKQIRPEDLSRRFHQASALYVGVVVGLSRHDRAAILRELKQTISALGRSNKKIQTIFARPGTRQGELAMKSNGFSPIGSETQIWVNQGPRFSL